MRHPRILFIAACLVALISIAPVSHATPYNVVTEGAAVGDGINDDTAEIQAALTAAKSQGRDVFFPAGTYLVSGLIEIPSETSLLGDTNGISLIKSTTPGLRFGMLSGGSIGDLSVEDMFFLNISMSMLAVPTRNIAIRRCVFAVDRVHTADWNMCDLWPSSDPLVEDCIFIAGHDTGTWSSVRLTGIKIVNNDRSIIRRNIFGLDLGGDLSWLETEWQGYAAWNNVVDRLRAFKADQNLPARMGKMSCGINMHVCSDTLVDQNIFNLDPVASLNGQGLIIDHIIYAKHETNLEITRNWMRGQPAAANGGLKHRDTAGPGVIAANYFADTPLLVYSYSSSPLGFDNQLIYNNFFEITKTDRPQGTPLYLGIRYQQEDGKLGENVKVASNAYYVDPRLYSRETDVTIITPGTWDIYESNTYHGSGAIIPTSSGQYTPGAPPSSETAPYASLEIPFLNIPEYGEPYRPDSDDDGVIDVIELAQDTDPHHPGSVPSSLYRGLVGWWSLDEVRDLAVAPDSSGHDFDGTVEYGDYIDLAAYYKLDEPESSDGVGAVLDSFGAHNGTTVNGAGVMQGSTTAKFGTAYQFTEGSGVNLGSAPAVQPTNGFTISFWFRLDSLNPGSTLIDSISDADNSGGGLRIDTGVSGDQFRVMARDGNGTTVTLSHPLNLAVDTWYFAAIRYYQFHTFHPISIYLIGDSPLATEDDFYASYAGGSPISLEFEGLPSPHSKDTLLGINNFSGSLDDVALFKENLRNQELFNIFRHGVELYALENPAITGQPLDFDGLDDHVALGNPAVLNNRGQITLSAWVKPDAVDGYRTIISHGDTATTYGEVYLRINNGVYEVGSWNGTSAGVSAGDAAADIGTWVHLAGVYDGTHWRLYRNGVELGASATGQGALVMYEGWSIGSVGAGNGRQFYRPLFDGLHFDGRIDDVRIYERGLTATEVFSIHNLYWADGAAPTADDATFAIAENGEAGDAVGTVNATDPDGDPLSYMITAGNAGGEFAINPTNGTITTTGALDFEATTQYVFTVEVSDGLLTDTATITVDVTNENDAPVAADSSASLPEDASIGTAAVSVSASDPNAGDTLSYAITAGNAGGEFAIDAGGNITVAAALDYEATSQHVLTVTVTDPGLLTDTATVDITVTNVDTEDSDGDGVSDALELAQGTNPYDPASVPSSLYVNLVGWWPLNEVSGLVVDDDSGYGHDGTVNFNSNLVAHYKLDESEPSDTAGAVLDSAGTQHGTTINGAGVMQGSATAKFGTAYQLTGGAGVNLGAAPAVQPSDDFTISLWLRPDSLNAWSRIIESLSGVDNYGNGIRVDTGAAGDDFRVLIRDGNGVSNTQYAHSLKLTSNTWYFAAIRYDKDDAVNGLRVTLIADTPSVTSGDVTAGTQSPGSIGTGDITFPHDTGTFLGSVFPDGSSPYTFRGSMDDVAYYDHVLTDDELANAFNYAADNYATGDPAATAQPLDFDGFDDHVDLGNPALLDIIGQITLSAWVKPDAVDGIRNIVAHGYKSTPQGEVMMRINNGVYEVGSWNGASAGVSAGDATADIGTWVHLVGVYDGTHWRLYRNGVELGSSSTGQGALVVNENWAIGSTGAGDGRFFDGRIGEVRIYKRGLTSTEALLLHNLYIPEYGDPPVADLDMDGMPDDWEIQHFGSTTISSGQASEDFDGDGVSDRDEYRWGTDPTSGKSMFAITRSLPESGGGLILRWASATGRTYAIEQTSDLRVGFSTLVDGLPATPPENTFTVEQLEATKFYRIRLK